ncbi:hypothetical protein BYT27DRAFT_7122932 [Phlegmacium glaucopus]|nr:hypothetical protein BYT27DRAFT_7122932 [Phlegmacium glaucopus]
MVLGPKDLNGNGSGSTSTPDLDGCILEKENVPITGPRQRKPASSKEVIPLTTKDALVVLPDWLESARKYLEEDIDATGWRECLAMWVKFEKEVGLSETSSQRLTAKLRPAVLSKWLQARKYHALPVIEDEGVFAIQWLNWWNSLQPEWRRGPQTDGQDA